MRLRPGEIWLADLGLAAKTRPVVIVSRLDPDPPRALVIYIPLTTQNRKSLYEVELPETGISECTFLRQRAGNRLDSGDTPGTQNWSTAGCDDGRNSTGAVVRSGFEQSPKISQRKTRTHYQPCLPRAGEIRPSGSRGDDGRQRDLTGVMAERSVRRPFSEWPTIRSGTVRMLFPGRASAVREVGTLSDLDDISVRIADVAARLAVFGDRLRDEVGSSTFP